MVEDERTVNEYTLYQDFGKLIAKHKQLNSKDHLKVRHSFDGLYVRTVLDEGDCDYLSKNPTVILFDGKFLKGKVKLPSDNSKLQWSIVVQ
ncbi:MAG: hypothetical protein PHQ86_09765 [Dehalococcoidales bacterium]|nr:hypothetical protein [Dehalococcoidales bacterium]